MISSAAYELRGNPKVLQHARKQGKCVLGISQTNAYIDKNGNHHGPADDWHPKVPRPIPRQPHYQPANDPCPRIMRSSLNSIPFATRWPRLRVRSPRTSPRASELLLDLQLFRWLPVVDILAFGRRVNDREQQLHIFIGMHMRQ